MTRKLKVGTELLEKVGLADKADANQTAFPLVKATCGCHVDSP